jgi:hypothetical protein
MTDTWLVEFSLSPPINDSIKEILCPAWVIVVIVINLFFNEFLSVLIILMC